MKTITIHEHPEYWGYGATGKSNKWASKMYDCAVQAGFDSAEDRASGTTDQCKVLCFGLPRGEFEEPDEVDWFARFCSHGFRGMVSWLKKQL